MDLEQDKALAQAAATGGPVGMDCGKLRLAEPSAGTEADDAELQEAFALVQSRLRLPKGKGKGNGGSGNPGSLGKRGGRTRVLLQLQRSGPPGAGLPPTRDKPKGRQRSCDGGGPRPR